MNRNALVSVLLLTMTAACALMSSCRSSGSDNKETDSSGVIESKPCIEPKSVEVEIFPEMPVKGEDADYFSISGPDGANTITIKGAPSEDSYTGSRGTIKFEIYLTVLKKFNDEIDRLGDYNGMTFHILDEDREEVSYFTVGDTDMELITAELGKSTPGTVTLIVKTDAYERSYNEFFRKAKYIRLENADIEGKKESEREVAKRERSSSSVTSQAYSNNDDDDDYAYGNSDSDDEEDRKSMKTVWKKVGKKAKAVKEKAAEKINDWLDD